MALAMQHIRSVAFISATGAVFAGCATRSGTEFLTLRAGGAVATTSPALARAECPANTKRLGGGAQIFPLDSRALVLRGSYPDPAAEAWLAEVVGGSKEARHRSWWRSTAPQIQPLQAVRKLSQRPVWRLGVRAFQARWQSRQPARLGVF